MGCITNESYLYFGVVCTVFGANAAIPGNDEGFICDSWAPAKCDVQESEYNKVKTTFGEFTEMNKSLYCSAVWDAHSGWKTRKGVGHRNGAAQSKETAYEYLIAGFGRTYAETAKSRKGYTSYYPTMVKLSKEADIWKLRTRMHICDSWHRPPSSLYN